MLFYHTFYLAAFVIWMLPSAMLRLWRTSLSTWNRIPSKSSLHAQTLYETWIWIATRQVGGCIHMHSCSVIVIFVITVGQPTVPLGSMDTISGSDSVSPQWEKQMFKRYSMFTNPDYVRYKEHQKRSASNKQQLGLLVLIRFLPFYWC